MPTSFSLGELSNMLTNQTAITQQKDEKAMQNLVREQTLTAKARRESQVVQDQSFASAEATRNQQLDTMSGIQAELVKAQDAIKLTDSDNPLDHLTLWALQQSDPSYTRSGNLARINYLQSAAEALGQLETIRQAGYQDQLTQIQNNLAAALQPDKDALAILEMRQQQGQNLIDAKKAEQAGMLGFLQSQNSIQEAQLSNMDLDTVSRAEQDAIKTGTVNVGGVDLSLAQIQTRKAALEERAYLVGMRGIQMQELALQDLTLPDVTTLETKAQASPDGRVEVAPGIKVSLARLQERKQTLLTGQASIAQSQFSLAQNQESLLQMTQKKIVQTMTLPELNKLIESAGMDETTGIQYDLNILRTERDSKAADQETALNQKFLLGANTDPVHMTLDNDNLIKSVQAKPGSPLEATLKQQKAINSYAAKLLGDAVGSQDSASIGYGITIAQNVDKNVREAVAQEAKRLASGDKDLELAYQYTLMGQQVPPDIIQSAIESKAASRKPLDNWLTGPSKVLFGQVFQRVMNDPANAMIMDQKAKTQMATQEAMQAVMSRASQGMTEDILVKQLDLPANPLRGVVKDKAELLALIREADQKGAMDYANSSNRPQEEIAALMSGEMTDPDFSAAQNAAFYQTLEKLQPGLGKRYVEWWNSPARADFIQRYGAQRIAESSAGGDFAKASEASLLVSSLPDQMAGYAADLTTGERFTYASDLARQHSDYVNFGGDPTVKQVFLLQQDRNLSDTDKQQAMRLIFNPILAQVKANNMNPEQASTFIEQQLKTMQPQDAPTRSLLKKILQGRDATLQILDDFDNQFVLRNQGSFMGGANFNPVRMQNELAKQSSSFDWWREMQ